MCVVVCGWLWEYVVMRCDCVGEFVGVWVWGGTACVVGGCRGVGCCDTDHTVNTTTVLKVRT